MEGIPILLEYIKPDRHPTVSGMHGGYFLDKCIAEALKWTGNLELRVGMDDV